MEVLLNFSKILEVQKSMEIFTPLTAFTFSPTCDYLEIAINGLSTSEEGIFKNTTSGKKKKIQNI